VVGHSSGEIAAAYAAGLLSKKAAIRAAYYRGQAAALVEQGGLELAANENEHRKAFGVMAVGIGAEEITIWTWSIKLKESSQRWWLICQTIRGITRQSTGTRAKPQRLAQQTLPAA
jgi:hypothetical protein